jgi:nicotinamidase-related amidase
MGKKFLFVIDMQNDFIDGSLGSDDAKRIVPNIVKLIQNWGNDKDNVIWYTYDTHYEHETLTIPKYENTLEGKMLPVKHCIEKTPGWQLNEYVMDEIEKRHSIYDRSFQKHTFGSWYMIEEASKYLWENTESYDEIHVCGLCTDICLANNVLLLRAKFPNLHIYVHENCCAGTSKEAHDAAITVMKSCQIEVI